MAMPMNPGAAPGLSVRERIAGASRDISAAFQERDEVIRVLMIAMLSGQNLLLLGEPGVAKSAIVRAAALHITDAKYAERLLTKFTLDIHLAGPPRVSALRDRDEYVRNMAGTPADAHFFFGDEVFRASGAALDILLPMINEHKIDGCKIPMRICVGASNFGPKEDYLAAVDDRFLLRLWVEGIQESGNFDALLLGGADIGQDEYRVKNPLHTWSLDEWEAATAEVSRVGLPANVVAEINKLWKKCRDDLKVTVSDRRWRKLIRVLQACAWLDGCKTVEPDHLDILRHCLWRKMEDRTAIFTMIDTLDSGDVKAMVDQGDAFIRTCTSWAAQVTLDERNKSASAVLATRKAIMIDLAARFARGSTRAKTKAADIWQRVNDAYVPVGTNLCQQIGMSQVEADKHIRETIYVPLT